jgi:hypothetical protein
MTKPTQHPVPTIYQNNPFMVAINGLNLLFKLAMSVAIFAIVLSAILLFGNSASSVTDLSDLGKDRSTLQREDEQAERQIEEFMHHIAAQPPEVYLTVGAIVLVVIFGFIVIATLITGVLDYTSSQLAKNKPVTINEAALAVMNRFFPYLWLQILVGLKIIGWTLLFIIPGIIMSVRYVLSGTVFFSEKLGANAATKRSSQLVKGTWLTTFASHALFSLITFGMIDLLLRPGTNAVLYHQYSVVKDKKPAAHWLSWLTLLLPIFLFFLFVLLIMFLIFALLNFTNITNP